jgi:hypothetical protein
VWWPPRRLISKGIPPHSFEFLHPFINFPPSHCHIELPFSRKFNSPAITLTAMSPRLQSFSRIKWRACESLPDSKACLTCGSLATWLYPSCCRVRPCRDDVTILSIRDSSSTSISDVTFTSWLLLEASSAPGEHKHFLLRVDVSTVICVLCKVFRVLAMETFFPETSEHLLQYYKAL